MTNPTLALSPRTKPSKLSLYPSLGGSSHITHLGSVRLGTSLLRPPTNPSLDKRHGDDKFPLVSQISFTVRYD